MMVFCCTISILCHNNGGGGFGVCTVALIVINSFAVCFENLLISNCNQWRCHNLIKIERSLGMCLYAHSSIFILCPVHIAIAIKLKWIRSQMKIEIDVIANDVPCERMPSQEEQQTANEERRKLQRAQTNTNLMDGYYFIATSNRFN